MNRTVRGAPPKTGEYRACDQCGEQFYTRPSEDRRGHRRRFCSRTCQLASYRGSGNPKWRGGRYYAASGYLYVLAPGHPHATQDGYVLEHRLVMERVLGRVLDPVEVVHHKNQVRDDNRPENLELLPSCSAHRIHHAYYEDHACDWCGVASAPVDRSSSPLEARLLLSRMRRIGCSEAAAVVNRKRTA